MRKTRCRWKGNGLIVMLVQLDKAEGGNWFLQASIVQHRVEGLGSKSFGEWERNFGLPLIFAYTGHEKLRSLQG
jgi:hypothetical protein